MSRKKLFASLLLLLGVTLSYGQGTPRAADFKVVCDTLSSRCNRHFGVKSMVKLERVMLRDNKLDLFFSRELSDYPWHEGDVNWFLDEFVSESDKLMQDNEIGRVMCSGALLSDHVTPALSNDGKAHSFNYSVSNPSRIPLVRQPEAMRITKGLSGRHIALWQSHGLYYNEEQDVWRWQRATLHRTVEDMFTQSFVLDYLIPMLENAGAVVLTPRERDIQKQEVICDNDPSFNREPKDAPLRVVGQYTENGIWEYGGAGFGDFKQEYEIA